MSSNLKMILNIAGSEIKSTLGGFAKFYIEYFKALLRIQLHPLAILDWLMMILFLIVVIFHPFFPAAFKILSSIFVIGISFVKTRKFIKQARQAPVTARSYVRGGILALFPFYGRPFAMSGHISSIDR